METINEPTTLQEAVQYFANPENCRAYLVARRWPDGVMCPRCGSNKVKFQEKYNRWQCSGGHANRQFTLKTGTIFEDSPIGLDKWLTAMWLVVNCKNGVSSWEVHRDLGVTQKTAWFMDHRIRLALQESSKVKLGGSGEEIEADESFIGGKARNMHKSVHARRIKHPGVHDKVAVMGILERGGTIKTKVVPNVRRPILQAEIRKNVEAGATIYTDSMHSYNGLDRDYVHKVIDHAVKYVDGRIHTNGLENFWSLLKRGIHGTYVSVEPFHLFRYLDEQSFRYNHRSKKDKPVNDLDRFDIAVRQIVGKRLTYKELTGKVGAIQSEPF
jgi:transposase-like protein